MPPLFFSKMIELIILCVPDAALHNLKATSRYGDILLSLLTSNLAPPERGSVFFPSLVTRHNHYLLSSP